MNIGKFYHLFTVSLSLFIISCSHPQVKLEEPVAAEPRMRVFDAHLHLHESEGATMEKLMKDYADFDLVAVVSHSPRSEPIPKVRAPQTPVRTIVCAALTDQVTPKLIEKALSEKRVECLKVYLGYIRKYAYDPFYKQFYKIAEKWKVPVVFHTGDTYAKDGLVKYAHPLTIDEVAVEFPKVKFLIAHMGNPWFDSAAEVVYKNDNVYVDLSALMLGDVSKAEPESVDELMTKPIRWFYRYVENPKKLLYGSDWTLLQPKGYIEAIKKAIPKEQWDAVFYQNAMDFFGVKNEAPHLAE